MSEALFFRYNGSMSLPKDQVEWVARLAHIELTEAEKSKYAEELSAVLGYVDELQKIDTAKADGDPSVKSGQITGLNNVLATDAVVSSDITREEFLKRAPDSDKSYIKVKSVFENRHIDT